MAPFYGWGSTASRLQPLPGSSLLFTIQFPGVSGTHFIDLKRMKGWVNLGALRHRFFLTNFAQFLKTSFLKNTYWPPLLLLLFQELGLADMKLWSDDFFRAFSFFLVIWSFDKSFSFSLKSNLWSIMILRMFWVSVFLLLFPRNWILQ